MLNADASQVQFSAARWSIMSGLLKKPKKQRQSCRTIYNALFGGVRHQCCNISAATYRSFSLPRGHTAGPGGPIPPKLAPSKSCAQAPMPVHTMRCREANNLRLANARHLLLICDTLIRPLPSSTPLIHRAPRTVASEGADIQFSQDTAGRRQTDNLAGPPAEYLLFCWLGCMGMSDSSRGLHFANRRWATCPMSITGFQFIRCRAWPCAQELEPATLNNDVLLVVQVRSLVPLVGAPTSIGVHLVQRHTTLGVLEVGLLSLI